MHSFLGVPVIVKGRSVGNLYLAEKVDGSFTDEDERLVEMFAVHAGIAIENARLHDQVQRLAIVEERERIGKDLHDGIIQSIYAVGLSLEVVPELVEDEGGREEAVARVDRAIDALNLVIADIRSYILRLRPTMGGEEDPVEALARLVEELGMHAVIDLEVDLDSGATLLRSLPPDRQSPGQPPRAPRLDHRLLADLRIPRTSRPRCSSPYGNRHPRRRHRLARPPLHPPQRTPRPIPLCPRSPALS